MLDEASQLSTADLAMIGEAARQAGARIIATGDTAQLGAVEAGGMFRLLAQEVPAARAARGPPVRRAVGAGGQRPAPRRRPGRGRRLRPARPHPRRRRGSRLRPRRLHVARRPPARQGRAAARRVQRRSRRTVPARPGQAHPARHASGPRRPPCPTATTPASATWSAPASTPRSTPAAANSPTATRSRSPPSAGPTPRCGGSGRTGPGPSRSGSPGPTSPATPSSPTPATSTSPRAAPSTPPTSWSPDSLSRQALYVGMTRGREANTAHVVTGKTAPPGHEPYQQATPESVLASVMHRDADDLSATEQIRQAQEWAGGTGHLLNLWSAAIRQALYPDIDQQITRQAHRIRSLAVPARALPPGPPAAAPRRPARRARHQRAHRPDHRRADGRRQVHLQRAARPPAAPRPARSSPAHDVTWAQRTPASAPAVAHELAAGLDDRARALGDQMAASPEPWLARQLGVLAPDASPALREEYARRAGARRRLPGSRRDHRPPAGRLPRPAPRQPRTREHAAGHHPPRWRYATKPTSCAAWTAANSKPGSSKANAPRPAPRRT